MSIQHTITTNWNNGGVPINNTVVYTGEQEGNWDGTVSANATDALIFNWSAAKLQDLYILSSQPLTLKTNGTLQVNTATIVGSCSGNGSMTVVVTSDILPGSPVTYSVPVTTAASTAALVAAVVRAYLLTQPALTALYTVGGTGAAVVLTAILPAANDSSLNIATATGSATGITTEASSVATTSGVAPQDTISLVASEPFVWTTSSGVPFPFAGTVTTTYFTAGGTAANLSIRSLYVSP